MRLDWCFSYWPMSWVTLQGWYTGDETVKHYNSVVKADWISINTYCPPWRCLAPGDFSDTLGCQSHLSCPVSCPVGHIWMEMPDITACLQKLHLVPQNGSSRYNSSVSMYSRRRPYLSPEPRTDTLPDIVPPPQRSEVEPCYTRGRYSNCHSKEAMMKQFLSDCRGHQLIEEAMVGGVRVKVTRSLRRPWWVQSGGRSLGRPWWVGSGGRSPGHWGAHGGWGQGEGHQVIGEPMVGGVRGKVIGEAMVGGVRGEVTRSLGRPWWVGSGGRSPGHLGGHGGWGQGGGHLVI